MPNKDAEPTVRRDSDDAWVEFEPPPSEYGRFWQPSGIERLKEMYGAQTAAELHPSLAFVDRGVVEQLRRARAVFVSKGFRVDAAHENYLGDGKSWALRCELTDKLPPRTDPLEVATQCQTECVKDAPRPFWEGGKIVVPLWSSGAAQAARNDGRATDPIRDETSKKGRGRPQNWLTSMRRQSICDVAATGVKGKQYCQELDARRVSTPIEWQKRDGCPKNYTEAWDHPSLAAQKKWRQRISDEKSKMTKPTRR